jgi:hypothetical protein
VALPNCICETSKFEKRTKNMVRKKKKKKERKKKEKKK